jgi:hypothetical protein
MGDSTDVLSPVVDSATKGARTGGSAESVARRSAEGRMGGGERLRGCVSRLTRVNRLAVVRPGLNEWSDAMLDRPWELGANESVTDRVR